MKAHLDKANMQIIDRLEIIVLKLKELTIKFERLQLENESLKRELKRLNEDIHLTEQPGKPREATLFHKSAERLGVADEVER